MKKTRIILICALIIAFACLIAAGCSKTEKMTTIELKDVAPDSVIELQIGDFDYSAYTVLVNYDSGSVEEIALSENMISELDRLKFYQPGDHTVTIFHSGKTCELKISVKRNTFGDICFPENNVFAYDGNAHTVEITGEIPPNATVSYVGGNSFVNAGTYNVTAVVACNGYVTKKITTTVTITPAQYDMSGVTLEAKEVVYDGKAHSIEISGQLPDGVPAPTYYINGNAVAGVTDVGEYKVTAVFAHTNTNYGTIPNLETTLKITPAEYDIGNVDLVFKNESGSSYAFPWKQYDGKAVTFNLNDNGDLKNKVSVSYTVKNEKGEVISKSNVDTKIKDAGDYTIIADFTLLDNKNYKAIESQTYTFKILKGKFDSSGVVFESKSVEYSGEINSITATIPATMDLTKFDVSYEYYYFGDDEVIQVDGKNVEGVYDAGEYTVKAVFKVKDPNYADIPSVEAKLVVEKKEISISQLAFYNTTMIYTGEGLKPAFYVDNTDFITVSDVSVVKLTTETITDGEGEIEQKVEVAIDEAKDVGEYRAKVTVSLKDSKNYKFYNGNSSVEISGDFEIRKAEIDLSDIGFVADSTTLVFDTKNRENLSFELEFFKNEGENRVSAGEAKVVTPDENGMISCILDEAFKLDSGSYICVITVSPSSTNYNLSNGDSSAVYQFEFSI